MKKQKEKTNLPDFVKAQFETIEALQSQVMNLQRAFNIEKACKNQVYYFILENGHFDQYKEYSSRNPVKY